MRNKLVFLVIWTSATTIATFGQSSKEVYKVSPNGEVTFSLEEHWWEEKNVTPKGEYLGDAQLTIQYSDGGQQTIVFLGSSEYLESKIEFSGNRGFNTWTQTGNLKPNATFVVISSQRAEAENAYEPVAGNHFGGGYITGSVARVSSDAPRYNRPRETPAPPVGHPGPVPIPSSANIHAIIISGRSDPAKIVTSSNVTLTGGIVALGKDPSPPVQPTTQWSSGLRIVPDEALLTGAKIPPITPNIIDVRIVSHAVTGNLSTPTP
jgi:hypothetical protein